MSAPLEQGETYQYRGTVTDAAGVPTNAGTVTATITLPDGTTVVPTIVNSGAGLYDFDYLTTQAGRHTLLVSSTGGTLGSATEKFDDTFNVEEPGRLLIGFDEARTALRGAATITSRDDREQLRWLILVASDDVERRLGRTVCRRSGIIEYFDGGQTDLQFKRPPPRWSDGGFITITSVIENGTTLVENTHFVVLRNPWRLHRGTRTTSSTWTDGYETVVATYAAGSTKPSATLRGLAAMRLQELWQTSQQASHPLLDESNIEGFGAQYALSTSNQFDEMLWRSLATLGIA